MSRSICEQCKNYQYDVTYGRKVCYSSLNNNANRLCDDSGEQYRFTLIMIKDICDQARDGEISSDEALKQIREQIR